MKHKKSKTAAGDTPPRRTKTGRRRVRRNAGRRRLDADALKQLHALQIHQAELEMQNEELRRLRAELHASLTRYTALYEFAPVGHLTLGHDSTILEFNQAAARLLGHEQSGLTQRRLGSFVTAESLPAFNAYLDAVFKAGTPQECEIELSRDDGSRLSVQMTAARQGSTPACLAVLIDITARRQMTQQLTDTEHLTQELLQQNRQLTRRMFELLESDRRNIAREIHDQLGQWLVAIQVSTGAMIRTEHGLQPATRASIRAINTSTAEMHNVLRRILLRLRPTLLDTIGLTEGLRELVHQWCELHKEVRCELAMEGELEGLGESINITLFRVVQESLTNVAKHAKASRVSIRLERHGDSAGTGGEISLEIDDDGQGYDLTAFSQGMGLLGMRERVIAVGGSFELSSPPAQGVRIKVRIPLPSGAGAKSPSRRAGTRATD